MDVIPKSFGLPMVFGMGLSLLMIVDFCGAPPVNVKKNSTQADATKPDPNDTSGWDKMELEYQRYLQEVVNALESDDDFRKKLEEAHVDDIRSGKIANQLNLVGHNVRTKLDEIKRAEMERLRHLAMQEYEQKNGINRSSFKVPVHLDLRDPKRFGEEDLRKLILQTTKDLEEADKQRKTDFKK